MTTLKKSLAIFFCHLEEVCAAGVLLEDGYHVGVVQERGGARGVVVHAVALVGQVTQRRAAGKDNNICISTGWSSGYTLPFVDIKSQALPQYYRLLLLKRNFHMMSTKVSVQPILTFNKIRVTTGYNISSRTLVWFEFDFHASTILILPRYLPSCYQAVICRSRVGQ